MENTRTMMQSRLSNDSENRLCGFHCLRSCLQLLAIFAFAASAWSQQQHFRIDPAVCEIRFELGAPGHAVEGTFHVVSGEFTLNAQTGAMTGMVTVDANSGESDSKSRDRKMATDQLKARIFPVVTFAPTRFNGQVKKSGDSAGQVEGIFTLIGQPHSISVPITVHIDGGHFSATGYFLIPYVSWGVKDPSFMILKVSKDVKIDLKLSGAVSR